MNDHKWATFELLALKIAKYVLPQSVIAIAKTATSLISLTEIMLFCFAITHEV